MDVAIFGIVARNKARIFVRFEINGEGLAFLNRTLCAGIPAKVIRALTDTELAWKIEGTGQYQTLAKRSLATMRAVAPLAAPEPGRKHLELPELLPLSILKSRGS